MSEAEKDRADKICPHCGKPQTPRVVPYQGKNYYMGFHNCNCPGAEAEREALKQMEERKAEIAAKKEHARRLELSGIPLIYRDAHADVDRYAAMIDAHKSIVFNGPVGVGKSHLASAIGVALIDRMTVRFTNGTQISASVFSNSGSELNFTTCGLLILDDLGKEHMSEWMVSVLYRIINGRYERNLPVIVTTNYSYGSLAEHMTVNVDHTTADAIVSRLREMANLPITLKGPDKRLQGR